MSSLSATLLAQTIDDHIAWMAAWTRKSFYADQGEQLDLIAPESFALWRTEALKTLQNQPALDRLLAHYEQLHQMARLVQLKGNENSSLSINDYDAVTAKYNELVSGLRRLERALAAADSGLDVLTGLRSRAGMSDDLTRELSRFERTNKPFCLALMDIDFFKKVNDNYGHEGGDRVLAAVANHVGRSLRPFDDAWRWGGEEILLCLKEVDLTAGLVVIERLRTGLEQMPIKLADGRTVNVTASFGLATVTKSATIDGLLEQADQALYRAKAAGRNRVEVLAQGKTD